MKPFPPNPQKILVSATTGIGETVMTTPAVRTIRENFPEAEITLLVHPGVSDIFRYSPRVDGLFLYEKNGVHRGLRGLLRLAGELRLHNYDCTLLLQNAFEAALITKMAGIPVRGGYITNARGLLLTHGVHKAPELISKHQVHYYQRLLRCLGLHTAATELELFIPGEQIDAAKRQIKELLGVQAGTGPLIGFNLGADLGPAKRWPMEKFADLANILCRRTDARILLLGSATDRQAATALIARADRCGDRIINLTGTTRLIEAMALIGECDVFVTNDSGLMHVAAALHTPLVAIFGSTDHIATGPFADNATVIRKPLPCSPCKRNRCPEKHLRCLKLIESDKVLAAVLTILEEA